MSNIVLNKLSELSQNTPSFGALLRKYREDAGLSQTQLREMLNDVIGYPISKGLLSNYEKSRRLPKDPDIIDPFIKCLYLDKDEEALVRKALLIAWLFDHIRKLLLLVVKFLKKGSKEN